MKTYTIDGLDSESLMKYAKQNMNVSGPVYKELKKLERASEFFNDCLRLIDSESRYTVGDRHSRL